MKTGRPAADSKPCVKIHGTRDYIAKSIIAKNADGIPNT